MDMTNTFDTLLEDIERDAFSLFFPKSEYRRSQQDALEHFQWLAEHLGDEEKEHLEKARAADLSMDTLEREAMVRTAIAAGIRLALAC